MTTDDRLLRIEEKLDRLDNTLARSCALHEACLARQEEHRATLYGNGKNGLKTRVESLEHSRQFARLWFGGLWAAVLVAWAALLKWFAKAF